VAACQTLGTAGLGEHVWLKVASRSGPSTRAEWWAPTQPGRKDSFWLAAGPAEPVATATQTERYVAPAVSGQASLTVGSETAR
jgi:hypothetical protein